MLLFTIIVFDSTVYARSNITAKNDPCATPNVRTNVRPDAKGPPVKISVGIRMLDLTAISDINQSLLNVSNWTVEEVAGTIGREYYEAFDFYTSRYDFKISAQRITGYYLWKVIMPLCLIVAMSWCVFWINPALYGPQIGLSATSILTLIAFIFATTNMVPELGYLALLDRFIVGSTILVFLALVESLTTVYLVSIEKMRSLIGWTECAVGYSRSLSV
jgi:hypothetical protein